jgi:nuclear transport factor 2 (NTF2) superfamily protein
MLSSRNTVLARPKDPRQKRLSCWATNPEKVAGAYTVGSVWRNLSEFLSGCEAIIQFLRRKWAKELDYRLIKELWAFRENRIAVRFAYEWHDDSGNWVCKIARGALGFSSNDGRHYC